MSRLNHPTLGPTQQSLGIVEVCVQKPFFCFFFVCCCWDCYCCYSTNFRTRANKSIVKVRYAISPLAIASNWYAICRDLRSGCNRPIYPRVSVASNAYISALRPHFLTLIQLFTLLSLFPAPRWRRNHCPRGGRSRRGKAGTSTHSLSVIPHGSRQVKGEERDPRVEAEA